MESPEFTGEPTTPTPTTDANDAKIATMAFVRAALENPVRCGICGGLIHSNSLSIDHVARKQDGGTGDPSNGQVTHPFCNTGIKN